MRSIAVLVFGVMLALTDGVQAYSIQMPPTPETAWLGADLQDLTKRDAGRGGLARASRSEGDERGT